MRTEIRSARGGASPAPSVWSQKYVLQCCSAAVMQ